MIITPYTQRHAGEEVTMKRAMKSVRKTKTVCNISFSLKLLLLLLESGARSLPVAFVSFQHRQRVTLRGNSTEAVNGADGMTEI
jgi:hypothetical protein